MIPQIEYKNFETLNLLILSITILFKVSLLLSKTGATTTFQKGTPNDSPCILPLLFETLKYQNTEYQKRSEHKNYFHFFNKHRNEHATLNFGYVLGYVIQLSS